MHLTSKHAIIYAFILPVILSGCAPNAEAATTEIIPTQVTPVETAPTQAAPTETAPTQATPERWELVWQDEFDGDTLDPDKWLFEVNDWGGGNEELQYYTARSENAYVQDGVLNIVAREEPYLTREYTSARLNSVASWTYGRFEIRAELPEGQGMWPAIWLHPTEDIYGPWAASGEIDIMEMLGHEPEVIYGTLHYGPPWPNDEEFGRQTTLDTPGFHVFALEWDAEEIRWYVDDRLFFKAEKWFSPGGDFPAPFDQPFYIILNLAVGGTWPGDPDETTPFPQRLRIDYVRVYQ